MKHCVLIIFCLSFMLTTTAQEAKDFFALSLKNQQGFLKAIDNKARKLDRNIRLSTASTLRKMKKQEAKLYRKLRRKDTIAAKQFLTAYIIMYKTFEEEIATVEDTSHRKNLKEYLPHFDTLKTSLVFIQQYTDVNNPINAKVILTQQSIRQLENRIQISNEVKRQLNDRKKILAQQFKRFGMSNHLGKLNKEIFYYQEQLKENKALLSSKKAIERKAIDALKKSRIFKEFVRKNSMLSQLFRLPDNYGTAESIAGLQTRANVEALLATRFAGAGVNTREYVQDQMNQAQAELSKIKTRLNKLRNGNIGNSSSDIDMPDNFKPNNQKTKPFLERLEYGANFQTQKSNGYFPVTTDVGLTLGYKLNDNSVIGIGAAYKVGWGRGIENIKLTHEGIGLRSYADVKLKGSFWITAGYEQNFFQRFNGLRQINNINVWRQSALIGVTKKIKLGAKRESNVQLLYDFMYKQNNLKTHPLIFRVGYKL